MDHDHLWPLSSLLKAPAGQQAGDTHYGRTLSHILTYTGRYMLLWAAVPVVGLELPHHCTKTCAGSYCSSGVQQHPTQTHLC